MEKNTGMENNKPGRERRRENIPGRRNIWNLVLGLIFLIYGSYRLYILSNSVEGSTLSYILAVAFVIFGLYDLWKYYKGL